MWDAIIITPFINVLLLIYHFIQSFGLAIILFTILIRLITHPLMVQQLKGTQAMQNLQQDPRWQEMQKKYKDDKEKLSQEQLKLYKDLGVNPFSSCLPTIIQFPIIIGLYQSIIHTLGSSPTELLFLQQRIYPFMQKFYASIIPINSHFLWLNLGLPDNSLKLSFLPFAIPVLAIIVVLTTYMQSKLMMPATSTPGDQGAAMGKMMNLYMPFLMGWMALTLASGLSIYFIASNVIGIIQYAALGKVNWRNLLPKPKKTDNIPASKKMVTIRSTSEKKSKASEELSARNPKPATSKPVKK
jgi:YidC/Oxa1 family membrane protein insertase